ncbi:MAG: methyltransferase domain-containing protein [Candidatus Lindowbacteria bacterium]|nr:methyltransferase domain-containing protein [Candidatus Lindowbacteria bacterium]
MNGKEEIMAIMQKARAYWDARILMTAAELNIFSLLIDRPKTATQVSKELSSDVRGTEALLNALAAMGLLAKKSDAFKVKPSLKKNLSNTSPETVVPMIRHMAYMWQTWSRLTDIVLKGRPEERRERDEESLKAFIGAMHSIGRQMATAVASRLNLKKYKSLIDVGGGSGVYTIAFLKAAPQMRATIFDLPPVIEIARKKVGEEKLLDRVSFVKGDFYKDPLPGGHDLALLSAIIHMNSPGQNVDLYRKIWDALTPGGTLVIRDHVMSKDLTKPLDGALFAINMLVATPGGKSYSFEEIREELQQAGFTRAKLVHRAEMDSLVTAQKPK